MNPTLGLSAVATLCVGTKISFTNAQSAFRAKSNTDIPTHLSDKYDLWPKQVSMLYTDEHC